MQHIANKIIEVDNGQPVFFPGDYDSYVYRKQTQSAQAPTISVAQAEGRGSQPTKTRSGRPRSAEEELRRDLSKEARRLAVRVDALHATLESHEARIAKLESLFTNPDQFKNNDQLATSGEEYRVLKDETRSLWEEWEQLSLEAGTVESQLAELKTS